MIGFMKRLVHGRQKKVFLILDNLWVHHSKAVMKWLAENEEKIQVFYLPSYSPELNAGAEWPVGIRMALFVGGSVSWRFCAG